MNLDEFWARVAIPDLPDEEAKTVCWLWRGAHNKDGYGTARLGGKTVYAFHVTHDDFFGPVLPGQVRRHRCNNRGCCNPFHILAGTRRENALDAVWAGSVGKLTPLQVVVMRARRAAGESSTTIAREMGIHPGRVRHICAARPDSWQHV